MMESKIMLFSEFVIQDRQTRSISVINIIEGMNVEGFPVLIPRLCVYNSLLLKNKIEDPAHFKCEVKLNARELFTQNISMIFGDKKRANSIISIQGLLITEPGILKASMYYKEKEIDTYEIEVHQISKPLVKTQQIESEPMKVQKTRTPKAKLSRSA